MLLCFIFCFVHLVFRLFRLINEQICLSEFFYLLTFHKGECRKTGKFKSALLSLDVNIKRGFSGKDWLSYYFVVVFFFF